MGGVYIGDTGTFQAQVCLMSGWGPVVGWGRGRWEGRSRGEGGGGVC